MPGVGVVWAALTAPSSAPHAGYSDVLYFPQEAQSPSQTLPVPQGHELRVAEEDTRPLVCHPSALPAELPRQAEIAHGNPTAHPH